MKNANGALRNTVKEWGSKARKNEEHERNGRNIRREVIAEQLDDDDDEVLS